MNHELQQLNKKIRLLNEVIAINVLFDADNTTYADKSFAEKWLAELMSKNCKGFIPLQQQLILKIAKQMRDFHFNKEVVIKRKVVNDRLINVWVQDPITEVIFPLNSAAFVKLAEKIAV